ncbi:MAG TPA: CerR family C-terminal domain-containing protein [Polyangiaceae bacterium]|nr:CerR family C-terminal domain-containing protein [Polyangiaceae bacterium]
MIGHAARRRSPERAPTRGAVRAARGDVATRNRVLGAATRLFAERGFRRVTVRDICDAASANVASVNYHFGDKERLYREVVESALEALRGFADQAMNAGPDASAEQKLEHYVRAHLGRDPNSATARRASVLRELFRHELSEPTPVGAAMVERALKPRLRYLAEIVQSLLGGRASDETVRYCVMSIQSQCLLPVAAPVAFDMAPLRSRAELERLVRHVVAFSLAGVRDRMR